MLFTSTPDVMTFEQDGRFAGCPLSEDPYGNIIVRHTGEKVSKVLRRVQKATFYRDGKEVPAPAGLR